MLTGLLASVVGVYAAAVAALAWRVARAKSAAAPDPSDPPFAPRVAVIVAARNEAADLPRCLDALLAQEYDGGRLEIIVANDHSTDETPQIVERVAASTASRLRCVTVPSPAGHLRGKAQAIHTAILASDADVFLITDADCAPPPTWVRETAAQFADPQVALVCGFSWMEPRAGHAFDAAQAVDWAFGVSALSALAEAGVTASGMGNNMGVRRSAYEAVGGYPALPFSVTEDFTLLHAILDKTALTLRYRPIPGTTVRTLPVDGLGAAYRQRQRWARGGLVGGAPILATYAALFAVHLAAVAGVFFNPLVGAALLVAKVGAEGALVRATATRLGTPFRWRDLPGFALFQFTYMLTLPVAMVVSPTTRWKDRTL